MKSRLVAPVTAGVIAGATVVALLVGNAFPQSAPLGIPDAGLVVAWSALFLRGIGDLASLIAFGLLVHALFVLPDKRGDLQLGRTRSVLEASLWIWLVGILARIVVGLADELGVPLTQALGPVIIRSYLTQTSVGRYLTAQLVLVSILVPMVALMRRWFTGFFLFVIAAVALVLPVLTGHAASSGNHALALGAIAIHMWAVGTWIGVVLGLWREPVNPSRVSSIAFGCAVTVVLSGVINVWVRFTTLSDLWSDYGRVVLLKNALLVLVLGLAYRARVRIRTSAQEVTVGFEVLVMLAIVVVSAVLSRMEPPIPRELTPTSAVEELTGAPMLPAPTVWNLISHWSLDGFSLALTLALGLAYFSGTRALRRRGDDWPINRTVLFYLGLLTFFYASNGGLAAYAKVAFSYHMVAHMFIVTLAPIGIVLGAPMTLALRTLPQGKHSGETGLRGQLQRALNSKLVWLVSHPIWALAVFDGSLFGLYFTGLFSRLMQWHVGHALMDIHFLAVGLLFFYVIIGIDPNPHRTPYIVRIVLLLGAMSLHAFFSVAVMSTTSLLDGGYYAQLQRPWATDLLADQHLGGSFGWAMGEVPIVLALIATFIQWVRADSREARRIDRAAARAEASGEDDDLAAYNAYLQKLAEQDRQR